MRPRPTDSSIPAYTISRRVLRRMQFQLGQQCDSERGVSGLSPSQTSDVREFGIIKPTSHFVHYAGRVWIGSEWAPLKAALIQNNLSQENIKVACMRGIAQKFGVLEGIQSLYGSGQIEINGAKGSDQHGKFLDFLGSQGVELYANLSNGTGSIGNAFTRDKAFVIRDTLYATEEGLASTGQGAKALGLAVPLVDPLDELWSGLPNVGRFSPLTEKIEGGDVMVFDQGNSILVGTNKNTSAEGFHALKRLLSSRGTDVHRIRHTGWHLDTCLAPLPNGEALYAPRKFPEPIEHSVGRFFKKLEAIDESEASCFLGTNMLWLNPYQVISTQSVPKTNEVLRKKGYEVHVIDYEEMILKWGSLRCTVCPLIRED